MGSEVEVKLQQSGSEVGVDMMRECGGELNGGEVGVKREWSWGEVGVEWR